MSVRPTALPLICVAVLTAGAASTRPSSAPAKVDTTPRPMASSFAAVRYRSIFVRGNQTIGRPPGPTTQGTTRPPSPPARAEATLAFTGVVFVGPVAEALIEDTAAHKVYTVPTGGPVAAGRVTAIRFDSLDYQPTDGPLARIGLGQTLAGGTPAPTTRAAPSAGGGGSADDILTRMRKRREAEEKGK